MEKYRQLVNLCEGVHEFIILFLSCSCDLKFLKQKKLSLEARQPGCRSSLILPIEQHPKFTLC